MSDTRTQTRAIRGIIAVCSLIIDSPTNIDTGRRIDGHMNMTDRKTGERQAIWSSFPRNRICFSPPLQVVFLIFQTKTNAHRYAEEMMSARTSHL